MINLATWAGVSEHRDFSPALSRHLFGGHICKLPFWLMLFTLVLRGPGHGNENALCLWQLTEKITREQVFNC